MKHMKGKNEKNRAIKEEEEQGEKAKGGAVDQIKRKYGFSKAKEGVRNTIKHLNDLCVCSRHFTPIITLLII